MNYWNNKNVLIISPEAWGMNFISKHHYAIELEKKGSNVFFLNPPKSRKTIFRVKNVKGYKRLFEIDYPLIIRGINKMPSFIADYINRILIKRIIGYTYKLDVVWSFDPYRLQNLDLFEAEKKIYFSADQHYCRNEKIILKSADLVLAPSKLLAEKFNGLNKNIYNIGHGVSGYFFDEDATREIIYLPGTNKLKVGYVGNLNYKYLALRTLEEIVNSNPTIDFIFIGPLEKSNLSHVKPHENSEFFKELNENTNVYLLGQMNYLKIRDYLLKFDLLLSCYGKGADHSILSNNHKTLEFLSSGKPIVSHYMDEYKDKRDLIQMADDNTDLGQVFEEVVNNITKLSSGANKRKKIKYAKEHTYEIKLKKVENLLSFSLNNDND